jgi:transcriptional regulator with XRE-family HTH domain
MVRHDAQKIRERRLELGLTQEEVSRRAKLTIATISQIENHHKLYIKPDTMEALTKALRCNPIDLTR